MKGKALLALTTAAVCTVALAACSSDDDSGSSTTTSGKQAVCTARSNLQDSVKSLTNLDVATEGKSGIQSSLKKVKQDLDDLGQSAKTTYQPDVDALRSALDQLETAVGKVGNQSITDSLQDVGNAVSKVGSTSATLASDLKAGCPS